MSRIQSYHTLNESSVPVRDLLGRRHPTAIERAAETDEEREREREREERERDR